MSENNDKKIQEGIKCLLEGGAFAKGFHGKVGIVFNVENGSIQDYDTEIKRKHR